MANREEGYGLSAEISQKQAAKFNLDVTNEAMTWIKNSLTHGACAEDIVEKVTPVENEDGVVEQLKDGVVLCNLANAIQPGSILRINTSKMAFKQMENISFFLEFCDKYGCAKSDVFQTVDLYEGQNVPSVITGLEALGRKCQKNKWDGPTFGKKEATENVREFTEEQLKAGEAIIGLQAGSSKGASQAGMNFGKTRAIID